MSSCLAAAALLLFVVDLFELRIDDIVAAGAPGAPGALSTGIAAAFAASLRGLIHGLAQLLRGFGQRGHLLADIRGVVALEGLFQGIEILLDLALLGGAHLVAELGQRFLGGMDELLGLV